MANRIPAHEQLVVEVYVRDLRESLRFYTGLGFRILREEPDFAELGWETSRLLLEEIPDQPKPTRAPSANVRIMVADVDTHWRHVQSRGIPVLKPIGDRTYGLRDFTIITPDGIGLRFATPLPHAIG